MRKRIFKSGMALLLSAGLMSSCSSDSPEQNKTIENEEPVVSQEEPTPYSPFVMTSEQWKASEGYWTFSSKLIDQVVTSTDDNFVISPLSLSMVLSMVANGASEDAMNEIVSVLGATSLADLNSFNELLIKEYAKADNQVKLALANSIWTNTGVNPTTSFTDVIGNVYDAEFFSRDLSSTATMNEINQWVDGKTNGMITNFLEKPLSALTEMSAINTAFFKGGWTVPFDPEQTEPRVFESANGSKNKIPTMHNEDSRYYSMADSYNAVELSYGNTAFRMKVYLPTEGRSIEDVVTALQNNEKSISGNSFVNLYLPRFETEYKVEDYVSCLKQMGINKIFDDVNAFTALQKPGIVMNKIFQKTKISVDESGAKAAAATEGKVVGANFPDKKVPTKVDFTVDRPFLFTISESSSHCVLFAGIIRNL